MILAKLKFNLELALTEEKLGQLVPFSAGIDGKVASVSFALLGPVVTYARK